MGDKTTLALDILTDLTRSPRDALRSFARISKRWKPASVGFILHMGGFVRAEKARRAFDERSIATWCDDGGRS